MFVPTFLGFELNNFECKISKCLALDSFIGGMHIKPEISRLTSFLHQLTKSINLSGSIPAFCFSLPVFT